MPQQKLNRTEIARLLVDLRDLSPSHRVSALCARLQTNRRHTVTDNPRILTGRNVKPFVKPTGPEEFGSNHQRVLHPTIERGSGVRDFEAYRFLCLALQD